MTAKEHIRVTVDAGAVAFEWTDLNPGDYGTSTVHATLREAKEQALLEAIPERDSWVDAVRTIRSATLGDVL